MASQSDEKGIELLAPAGQMESLRAAIANGADAVYLGIGPFNARRRAENFTPDQLPELREVTARCNVRLYAAMNTLLMPDELDAAAGLIERLAGGGVDAVIVQDAGLAELATAMAPDLPLHASTQMTLSEPGGIELARRRWNLRRVILPRETSLDDLRAIADETAAPAGAAGARGQRGGRVELEMFVHGAMCISYSGQCHAGRHLGGRSGNRGQCAQPCRLAWELLVDGRPRKLAGRHVLSPRDLCLLDRLGDMLSAGATSFKIEGRLKDAGYVAAAVRVYRTALDAALAGRDRPAAGQADRDGLQLGFSRGFTRGYLDGNDPRGLVDASAPCNLGLRVGQVSRRSGRQIVVLLDNDFPRLRLSPGDGVAFGLPDAAGRRPGGSVYEVQPTGGGRIAITLGRDAAEALQSVEPGQAVWKTSDPKLQRELRQSYARLEPRRRVRIDIRLEAITGLAPVMRCGAIEVRGAEPLQAAKRQPLTRDALAEQLARLGDTPLELGRVELIGPAGPAETVDAMVPKSVINDLRRRLTERIVEQMHPRRTIQRPTALAEIREQWHNRTIGRPCGPTRTPDAAEPALAVLVRQAGQVGPAVQALARRPTATAAGRVYLELPPADLPAAISAVRAAGMQAALVSPRVISPDQRGYVQSLLALDADAMLVRNLGSLALLRRSRPDWLAVGDASLNAVNEASAAALVEMGLDVLTPGADIDSAALAGLVANSPPGVWELPIRLHEVLFHTQYCLFSHYLIRVPVNSRALGRQRRRGLAPPCCSAVPVPGVVPVRPANRGDRHLRGEKHAASEPVPFPRPVAGQNRISARELFGMRISQGRPGGQGATCEKCPQPCLRHRLTLRDSAGRSFEVRRDGVGRCDILAADGQTRRLPPGLIARLAATRVELLDEPAEEIARLLAGAMK